ncbi:hypothetical protein Vretimale_17618 [Volvox reticuliferus]|uniref:Uncharacterized protein n=1 Tax=Volvox reticuliferus TaxID=1737510 RepID=A0A8J4FV99_9CHLO|nr:hypothetical protein Vretifemale_18138 [Volvox reticuliferus]GIM14683.1 hypothetical protein Vretimale_17618 [Volvox reticuliferus]
MLSVVEQWVFVDQLLLMMVLLLPLLGVGWVVLVVDLRRLRQWRIPLHGLPTGEYQVCGGLVYRSCLFWTWCGAVRFDAPAATASISVVEAIGRCGGDLWLGPSRMPRRLPAMTLMPSPVSRYAAVGAARARLRVAFGSRCSET